MRAKIITHEVIRAATAAYVAFGVLVKWHFAGHPIVIDHSNFSRLVASLARSPVADKPDTPTDRQP